jgi:DNA-binding CsgD family transcriptional regulator
MNYNDFSKKELSVILDVIQSVLSCQTKNDIIRIMARVKMLLCADRGICGLGIVNATEGPKILDLINLDYPTEWLSLYANENLYKSDPIILHQLKVFKPQFWSEAYDLHSEKPYSDFIHLAEDFELKHGLASGLYGTNTDKICVFSFSGGKSNFESHQKKILDILTPHLFQGLVRTVQFSKKLGAELTEREREVIQWIKEGKTNWEISVILNISERTVKFHIQNIERKLNAVNKAHAVAIAMEQDLIIETSS